ncbi:MAG TPA: hypothetical protein VGD77_06845 [Gemmatimonadaceae bacterium]
MRWNGARVAFACLSALCVLPAPSAAQWVARPETSFLPGGFNWQFRRQFPRADRVVNAIAYAQDLRFETLWTRPPGSDSADARRRDRELARSARGLIASPPRLPPVEEATAAQFAKLVPEAAGMLSWARQFRRQLYDLAADPSLSVAALDGRITELLGHYRSRPELALASLPKRPEAAEGQFYSVAFRRAFPLSQGLAWAARGLQLELLELLLQRESPARRIALVDSSIARFGWAGPTDADSLPSRRPLAPVVAPALARRYPGPAAILDNLGMLEDVVADILASPDVPRSAKRREILRAAEAFRSDTVLASRFDAWLQGRGEQATSHEMSAHDMAASHEMGAPNETQEVNVPLLIAIHRRMLADPVVQERVATDPVLQRMLAQLGPLAGTAEMPGHAGMPEMTMAPTAMSEERRQAVEFIVRLLSDPTVESRIHSDPELHRLWSDPAVRKRLNELRQSQQARPVPPATLPRTEPAPAPPPGHQHP